MKKLLSALLASALALGLLAGCGGNGTTGSDPSVGGSNSGGSGTTATSDLKGDLVFAIWDNNLLEYIEANDMEAKFQETYPNISVEVEKIKDDSEYWNSMKMRASANQLPDVMFNKPFTLSRFQDYLLDLSGIEACKNNTLAQGYAINGKVLGIPMTAGYEYVYYWKDMFQEAGVQVPTTWEELKDVSKKLQDYYGAKDPDFMAIALGAKDEWPTYPYMEVMPALISGNGQNWNDMAKSDAPFARAPTSTSPITGYMTCSPAACWARTPGHEQGPGNQPLCPEEGRHHRPGRLGSPGHQRRRRQHRPAGHLLPSRPGEYL